MFKDERSKQEVRTMRLKALFVLLTTALFISVEPAMADKSYHVTMASAAKVGSMQLQPGEYKVVLDDHGRSSFTR
jgi:hypothetical protein